MRSQNECQRWVKIQRRWWVNFQRRLTDTEGKCTGLADGTLHFESNSGKLVDPICFSRDPDGAARNLADRHKYTHAIRAQVHLDRHYDRYTLDSNLLANGFDWLKVYDVRRIMVLQGSVRAVNQKGDDIE